MKNKQELLEKILAELDISESSYQKAEERYKSLGEWFHRAESSIRDFDPRVFPQGSFSLGLVNRPFFDHEEYDLDVVCELLKLSKSNLTQQHLKALVGAEVGAYRVAKNISAPVDERNRCWRLDYADEISFHIDILPSLPEDPNTVGFLISLGVPPELAATAIAITHKKHSSYSKISNDWPTSNPSGFRRWFEGRMGQPADLRRAALFATGRFRSIEEIKTYSLKTPLQQSIRLLKRHRDVMFRSPEMCELSPISIIITTLSAYAYGGENDIPSALTGILDRMEHYIQAQEPRISNPVNPGEDFADKWKADPRLEHSFRKWLAKAKSDFADLFGEDSERAAKILEGSMNVSAAKVFPQPTQRPQRAISRIPRVDISVTLP